MQPEQSWYVGVNGQQQGPLLTSQIFQMVQARTLPDSAYVFTQGMATWTPIRQVPQFAAAFGGAPMMPPPMPSGPAPADVIDYKINGEELQYIEITLDPGEACVSESGAMLYVENDVVIKQLFGDGTDREQGAKGHQTSGQSPPTTPNPRDPPTAPSACAIDVFTCNIRALQRPAHRP